MPKAPLFDFSHLTTEERIELAMQLWDSLPHQDIGLTEGQRELLDERLAALEVDGDPGEPWETVLGEIEKKGY